MAADLDQKNLVTRLMKYNKLINIPSVSFRLWCLLSLVHPSDMPRSLSVFSPTSSLAPSSWPKTA
jgi:hypothetical protein